mmetsp:Transcript_7770/g.15889  ORF Transcript_7770/g.15889 Transcript_7770/m.15889 type:complete len:224 (+) Transcript_7770:593-1264(+)
MPRASTHPRTSPVMRSVAIKTTCSLPSVATVGSASSSPLAINRFIALSSHCSSNSARISLRIDLREAQPRSPVQYSAWNTSARISATLRSSCLFAGLISMSDDLHRVYVMSFCLAGTRYFDSRLLESRALSLFEESRLLVRSLRRNMLSPWSLKRQAIDIDDTFGYIGLDRNGFLADTLDGSLSYRPCVQKRTVCKTTIVCDYSRCCLTVLWKTKRVNAQQIK